MNNEERIIKFCVEDARDIVLRMIDGNKATCILMVRVIMRVLQRFGYASQPLSVNFKLWNAIMRDKVEAHGSIPQDKETLDQWYDDGAYMVEINEDPNTDGYPGHLILKTEGGWLLDASIDQASRPGKELSIDNWYQQCPSGFPQPDKRFQRGRDDGATIYYWLQEPLIKDFTTAPDWNIDLHDSWVNEVMKWCKQIEVVTKKQARVQEKPKQARTKRRRWGKQ